MLLGYTLSTRSLGTTHCVRATCATIVATRIHRGCGSGSMVLCLSEVASQSCLCPTKDSPAHGTSIQRARLEFSGPFVGWFYSIASRVGTNKTPTNQEQQQQVQDDEEYLWHGHVGCRSLCPCHEGFVPGYSIARRHLAGFG